MFGKVVFVFLVVQVSGTPDTSVLSPYIGRILVQALTPAHTLSASFPKVYTCPKYETHMPGTVALIVPCGSVHASLPGHESLNISWIISPTVPGIWINITVVDLKAVFSRPRCQDQYLALLSPTSTPKERRFCGNMPQFTMLYSENVTVVLFSKNIQQPTVYFSYQFIKKPQHEVISLEPKTVYLSTRCRLRPEVYEDLSISVQFMPVLERSAKYEKRSVHFIPDITFSTAYEVSIFVTSCHVTVHEGPGIRSPVLYDSSVLASCSSVLHERNIPATWGVHTYLQLYVTFMCTSNLEHSSDYLEYSNINSEQARNLSHPYLQLSLSKEQQDVIPCADQFIEPVEVSSGHFTIQVVSYPHKNTWCVVQTPPNILWLLDVEMQYYGSSHLYADHQSLACQLGGVFLFSDTTKTEISLCSSQSNATRKIFGTPATVATVMFYTGYTHGFVVVHYRQSTLDIPKVPLEGHFYNNRCKKRICITIYRYWINNAIYFLNGSAVHDRVIHLASGVVYPANFICLHRRFFRAVAELRYDVSIGNGHFELGRVHVKSYLACQAVNCSLRVTYSHRVVSSGVALVRWDELGYKDSYMMDYEVPNALFIRMQMVVIAPFDVYYYYLMQKIEECRYHTDMTQISMISHDCKEISIPFHLGHALFRTQKEHNVRISVRPDCNVTRNGGVHMDVIMQDGIGVFSFVWQDAILLERPLEIPGSSGLLNISWNTFPHIVRGGAQCSIVIEFPWKEYELKGKDYGEARNMSNGFQIHTNLGYNEFISHVR